MKAVTDSSPDATPRPLPQPEQPAGEAQRREPTLPAAIRSPATPATAASTAEILATAAQIRALTEDIPPRTPEPAAAEPAAAEPAAPEPTAAEAVRRPVAARRDGFPVWPERGAPPVPDAKPKPPVIVGNAAWPAPYPRAGRLSRLDQPSHRSRWGTAKQPRHPAVGLAALVALALLAAFFGWVSADSFWLAVGHAEGGTATVTRCAGSGLGARCVGTFKASDFSRERVALSALPRQARHPGAAVPARMVSESGRIAYSGNPAALHIRWMLDFALILLCGAGIGWATGAGRVDQRARTAGYAASVSAPVLLLVGMLIYSW
jgi:hypothetical protein